MNRVICGTLLATLCAAMLGCSGASGAVGKATPEATFESFKSALKGKDYQGAFGHLTSKSQDFMLGCMAMAVSFAAMDPEKGDDAKKLMEMMSGVVEDVKDKPACFAAVMEWMDANAPKDPMGGTQATPADQIAEATLTDVTIEGDTARGKITSKDETGQEKSQPAMFKKIDGVWLIEFEIPKAGQMDAGPDAGPTDGGLQLPSGDTPQLDPSALPDFNKLIPPDGTQE